MALGLGAAPLSATSMVVELDHGHIRADLQAEELAVGIDSKTSSYRWKGGRVETLKHTGAVAASANQLRIDAGVVEIADKRLVLAEVSDVAAHELSIGRSGTELWCTELGCQELRFDGRELRAEGLRARGLWLKQTLGSDRESRRSPSALRPTSFDFLDRLHGRLDADVEIDYDAKVIGRRRAVHKFHLPISDGSIDYRRLESGLAHLENSVIDIELDGDRLIVEKDLPLIPFDNTTLLSWPLTPEEKQLAETGRIRLARLLDFEIPKKPEGKKPAKPSFTFYGVMIEKLAASLTLLSGAVVELIGGGKIELGCGDKPAVRDLELVGHLSYHREDPQPSRFEVLCPELNLGAESVSVGQMTLGQLALAADELKVVLELDEELRPTALTAEVGELRIDDLTLQLGDRG
ncbi:MAG: hypothetical protein KJO07_05485 [Deltaproteobacteria bacterium]|nr:hypothetical protein [Deltaproteobacteria bacterium]